MCLCSCCPGLQSQSPELLRVNSEPTSHKKSPNPGRVSRQGRAKPTPPACRIVSHRETGRFGLPRLRSENRPFLDIENY